MSAAASGSGRFARAGAGPGWWRWLVPLLAAVLLLAPGPLRDVRALQQRRAWQHDPTTPWILDAPTGVRSTAPADLAVMVDESASTAQSDPGRARWIQATQLLRWMSRHAPADRITIGTFAASAPALGPLRPARVAALPSQAPLSGSSTNFVPAVDRIDSAFASSPAARQQVAVLVTDGDGGDVEAALRRLDPRVRLYVFGLDDDGTWSRVRKRWGDRVRGTSVSGDAGSIAAAEATLLSDLTGQHVTAHQQRYSPGARS
jgi:hypothetical protein